MIINVFYFTHNGEKLADRLRRSLPSHEFRLIPKDADRKEECARAFRNREAIIFIGAAGIAVRTIAPFLESKLKDPPVIVIDEHGRFVIPVLSGHIGGANDLARETADAVGGVPVITTATDLNDAFSVDIFAKENELAITDKEGIARVSSSALEGKPVTISIKDYPPAEKVDVLITDEEGAAALKDTASIVLCPKRYALGIGCRRDKPYEEIRELAVRVLSDKMINIRDVGCIATIDIKKDEEGLKKLSEAWRTPLITFDAEVLAKAKGEFTSSERVLEQVGVDNVCERAAVLAAGPGAKLIIKKTAENGITIAVAERKR